MKIDCPFCFPENTNSLNILKDSHSEYQLALKTMDGTKKWYQCEICDGVFCRDKLRNIWQLSPDTYLNFIEKGLIKNLIDVK